jgi:hypothetical protein
MKFKICFLFLALSIAQLSFATGGFLCSGETNSGKKVEVYGCIPHMIPGLCGDVTVTLDGKELFTIERKNVVSFYESAKFLGLIGMDKNFDNILLQIEYFGKGNSKNSMRVSSPQGKKFLFKDINCERE